jgi:hypothetical protein
MWNLVEFLGKNGQCEPEEERGAIPHADLSSDSQNEYKVFAFRSGEQHIMPMICDLTKLVYSCKNL